MVSPPSGILVVWCTPSLHLPRRMRVLTGPECALILLSQASSFPLSAEGCWPHSRRMRTTYGSGIFNTQKLLASLLKDASHGIPRIRAESPGCRGPIQCFLGLHLEWGTQHHQQPQVNHPNLRITSFCRILDEVRPSLNNLFRG